MDESTIAKVNPGERDGLSPTQLIALELADALMTAPGQIPPDLVRALRASFTDEQLLELTLDVMKWNAQKVPVALGTDDEIRPGELSDLVFDSEGRWVRG